MKKHYSKPDIMFESFTLSTSIAGSCETVIDTMADGQCGVKLTVFSTIFLEGINGCTKVVIDGSKEANGLCYHQPTEANNLFNS